ncbi:uncharacterized protein LOC143227015 [Tachypleus tridentatus]|uniref:uncharacterized protein LOC143227015 n=1 Tax=Tachypleus tridentatus TaxID=6853 RepID=UPI003FCF8A8C
MKVVVTINDARAVVYLDKLKGYPDCQPEMNAGRATFYLPLHNINACGTIRVLNKMTGQRIFYHRVVIDHQMKPNEIILVKCAITSGHYQLSWNNKTKGNVLPENFVEPEQVNITNNIVARAPLPFLNVAFKQGGKILDTTLNVKPGTSLEMLIYLDEKIATTYGLLTSYLKVTDLQHEQEEVIIMNGCSIDSYIFGNFYSSDDGNMLSAKLRAFKFPLSYYVLFVGTVNICLKKCQKVICGQDQYDYVRKKRQIPDELPPDPNKMFEVEMTAFMKVEYTTSHLRGSNRKLINFHMKNFPSLKTCSQGLLALPPLLLSSYLLQYWFS